MTSDRAVPRLTLYSRTYCHLCEDMLAALQRLRGEFDFEVEVVDVDSDPALVEVYDERVPVLVGDGGEICHYFLDEARTRSYLAMHSPN